MKHIISLAFLVLLLTGCSKVSPTGLLIAASNVDDRYNQAQYWFNRDESERSEGLKYYMGDELLSEYSFLIGADPHIVGDLTRMTEFFEEAIKPSEENEHKPKYQFCAVLGDIVDTQPEFYSNVNTLYKDFKTIYKDRFNLGNFTEEEEEEEYGYQSDMFRFYAVVGNHDITHNGWAMFYDIFGISTYAVIVGFADPEDGQYTCDVHLFLDSANGTMGKKQYDNFIIPILEMAATDNLSTYVDKYLSDVYENSEGEIAKFRTRHKFVYTHNPFFRSRLDGFSSNYPREEYYRLLDDFATYKVDYVFAGHLHDPGYNEWRGVKYVLLDAFGERNRPKYGEVYNVTCKRDGSITVNPIHLK